MTVTLQQSGSLSPDRTPLAPREREVLRHLAAGCTRRQIAHRMSISISTVSTYLERLRKKLEAPTQAHLIRAAIDLGM